MPEAACTSTQFHVQTSPDTFAEYWNASQAICSIQLALGANSPYLLGQELWRETRIPLFEQSTDTRAEELKAQGVRPRVWFGERWINSVFDLFEENVRYFPALLPITEDEDPLAVLEAGGTPTLSELRLHNGTIYRWNRPVYDIAGGVPHLRVENRVLAAGPTVADTVANAAFYFGLVRALAESERPLWSQMSFSAAEENFHVAAQHGIDAQIYWPGVGQVRATELTLRRLLPMAREGLAAWGVDTADERPAARHHRAALPARHQRRRVVRAPDGASGPTWSASTRCARRCWSTASGCTPTSRCTPGTRPTRRLTRGRSRTQVRVSPLRGSRQPRRLTTTKARAAPASAYAARAAASHRASTSCSVELAGPGQPDHGSSAPSRRSRTRSAATTSVRSPGRSGSTGSSAERRRRGRRARRRAAPAGAPAAVRCARGRPRPGAAARRSARVQRFAQPFHPRTVPGSPRGPRRLSTGCPRRRAFGSVPDGASGYPAGAGGETMPTVVLGYVPKPEGEAALAAVDRRGPAAQGRPGGRQLPPRPARRRRGATQAIEAELDEVRARVEEAGVDVDVRHPETGLEAAEDLLSIADEVGAELIVIGLRRRTPVGKLILGSNAQRILLDAHCPVLAVKAD